ncbi:hypothetical protein FCV25MIE_28515 [Fagus crenata]
MLDGSLRLLDVCSIARDALLQTKECTRELQSTLRRRQGSKMEITRVVEKYLASRKVVKKAIQKALKGMQIKFNYKNVGDLAIISMLKELEAVTCTVFESYWVLLLNQSCNQSRPAGFWFPSWCFTKEWHTWIGKLELNVQDLEEVIECLSRRMVKTQVSVLNILNH